MQFLVFHTPQLWSQVLKDEFLYFGISLLLLTVIYATDFLLISFIIV